MTFRPHQPSDLARRSAAFTLLEVIIACSLFFMCAFAVLQIITTGLVAAKKLQRREPHFEFIISQHVLTNQLTEGVYSGSFGEIMEAMPDLYPGFSWECEILEVSSNGFFRIDYAIFDDTAGAKPRTLTTFMHKPASPPGSATQPRR